MYSRFDPLFHSILILLLSLYLMSCHVNISLCENSINVLIYCDLHLFSLVCQPLLAFKLSSWMVFRSLYPLRSLFHRCWSHYQSVIARLQCELTSGFQYLFHRSSLNMNLRHFTPSSLEISVPGKDYRSDIGKVHIKFHI